MPLVGRHLRKRPQMCARETGFGMSDEAFDHFVGDRSPVDGAPYPVAGTGYGLSGIGCL